HPFAATDRQTHAAAYKRDAAVLLQLHFSRQSRAMGRQCTGVKLFSGAPVGNQPVSCLSRFQAGLTADPDAGGDTGSKTGLCAAGYQPVFELRMQLSVGPWNGAGDRKAR